ncbi:hypothetical protein GLOIN_2v1779695 [Rhizophagus clarus]|nr:hypothetical protein GLOIN_2v1779695 [Rhizophagus clarus]
MDIVFKLLFKTFVENENSVNLHTFEFEIHKYSHFSTTYELILQNPNFLRNIRNFKFYYSPFQHEKTIYLFLNFIFSNCNLISSIQFSYNSSNALINEYVLKLINSQHNLKKFVLRDYNKSNYPLLPLKIPNYSNTLKTIIFYCVDFKYVVDVNGKIFERLNVLESVHILHCYSLEYLIQQIINIEKPFQLKSLFMNGIADIKSLELLLRKSGDYLENFVFGSFKNDEQKNQIFELLIKYCTKIKFIDLIGVIICQNIFLVFGLIENIKQNLNHLSIDILDYSHQFIDDVMLSSTVLLNLGQILPCRLEYLNLSLKINTFHLLVFLKNSQNTFIRKLLIRDAKQEKSEEILPYIKEYIMKKKRVRYLAILGNLFGKEENLVSSKDEVKEFELYDIEIQHYDDLFIQIHDYMNLLMQY